MKRALAERAKQSGLPNGVGPASPKHEMSIKSSDMSADRVSSSSNGPVPVPPTSAPREALKITSQGVSSTAPPSSSPRPKKRLRESSVKLDEEEEDDSNSSAFYLRHQNRALASELRMLKYELVRLERERDYRRSQSSKAVQSLNALQATWTQMESALQCGQPPPPAENDTGDRVARASTITAPSSTGLGSSVELIGALLDSLAALGTTTPSKRKRRIRGEGENDDDSSSCSSENQDYSRAAGDFMDEGDSNQLDDLLRITDNVSKRAGTMQRWIWSLLQRVEAFSNDAQSEAGNSSLQQQQQLARLRAKNKTLKSQLKELARSRDEMSSSDKRVRRGLYRLAAGRVKLKEVLKAIVVSDEDKEAAASWMEVEAAAPAVITSVPTTTVLATKNGEAGEKGSPENVAQIATLSKQVTDLEQVAQARDEQIKKLLSEREEQLRKINSLVLQGDENKTSTVTEEDIKQSDLYAEIAAKLSTSERGVQTAEEKLLKVRQEWGQALADSEAAKSAMEDMQAKHLKRWKDIVDENPDISGGDETPVGHKKAEEIIRLQHKLTQALENVRQAETTRKTLEEAVAFNQSLQAKLEELKAKYSALQANRTSSNANNNVSASSSSTPSSSGLSTPKQKHSSSSGISLSQSSEKSEKTDKDISKMHRDYRKVRKELAAATASKEAAKAKLSASEKERESLNQTNSRLLKQASERDDVNAKSLSTILHLKQLTEQITKEKENLEQQVKSSQQVALAARLATNARERLSEELEKEHKELEARANTWEQKCGEASKDKEALEAKLSQQQAKVSSLQKDCDKAKQRCDELASESTKLQEERQRMLESLAVARREAAEATKVSQSLSEQAGSSSGGGLPSGFTVDQLNTQVSVLKSRLACPVCNHRDKKCILLRCRHMFCKQCVDENIKNRSRKCPACGGRFDTKDVADVWL